MFGLDLPPLAHGVVWSLLINVLAYVVFSLQRLPSAIERVQADVFVPTDLAPMAPTFRRWRSSVTVEELTATVARYLGDKRTRSSFESFAQSRRISLEPKSEANIELLRYAEHLLASGIGAASSRLVLSLLLRKRTVIDRGRAEIARRRKRGDPLQPRSAADRARSRASGYRRVRQRAASGVLEPAVRRDTQSAAQCRAGRRNAARALGNSMPSVAHSAKATLPLSSTPAFKTTPTVPTHSLSGIPTATWSSRCAAVRCRAAVS